MGETTYKTADGQPKVYSSPRPQGMTTYFSGAGDDIVNNIIGGGPRLIWKMAANDISKSIDIQYLEDIYVKDGYIYAIDAPLGAYIDIDVIMPTSPETYVGSFGKKVPVLGTGWFPLDTEDRGPVPYGLILRITLYNSAGGGSPTINDEDPPKAFTVAGRIEMFRSNT